jgi:hypothetical protein
LLTQKFSCHLELFQGFVMSAEILYFKDFFPKVFQRCFSSFEIALASWVHATKLLGNRVILKLLLDVEYYQNTLILEKYVPPLLCLPPSVGKHLN